jgi:glycine/sarcosine N-methyltransferase
VSRNHAARFYDQLADDYHLVYADWDASTARQGESLNRLIRAGLGADRPVSVLDCSCGIGTQAIGLALRGHHVTGSDISPVAVGRAAREAGRRGLRLPVAAADMRRLPFGAARFDVVVCADNSLPHLLTETDVRTALAAMRRTLRDGGLLVISTRPYDEILRSRPVTTLPQLTGRAITFQVWHWHDDGRHYDVELFRLLPEDDGNADGWRVRVGRATYWALTQDELTGLVSEAGFAEPAWHTPESSGFFQPVLTARTYA